MAKMTQKTTFDMSTLLNMRVKQCEFDELLFKANNNFFLELSAKHIHAPNNMTHNTLSRIFRSVYMFDV